MGKGAPLITFLQWAEGGGGRSEPGIMSPELWIFVGGGSVTWFVSDFGVVISQEGGCTRDHRYGMTTREV